LDRIVALVRRCPLASFLTLACALSWPIGAPAPLSDAFPFVALLGPAVAGLIVARLTGGEGAVRELLGRLKVPGVAPKWKLVAALSPAAIAAAAGGLSVARCWCLACASSWVRSWSGPAPTPPRPWSRAGAAGAPAREPLRTSGRRTRPRPEQPDEPRRRATAAGAPTVPGCGAGRRSGAVGRLGRGHDPQSRVDRPPGPLFSGSGSAPGNEPGSTHPVPMLAYPTVPPR
jgi:hypothetical protein